MLLSYESLLYVLIAALWKHLTSRLGVDSHPALAHKLGGLVACFVNAM